MAKRSEVISINELWDIFDAEREKAWDGVDAEPGEPAWEIAAGKIKVINNICHGVCDMNAAERSSGDKAEVPIWKSGESVVHTDYANGSADTRLNRWAAWVCPRCASFVGEQFTPGFAKSKPHNQHKCNFCPQCGQKIDWAAVERKETPAKEKNV